MNSATELMEKYHSLKQLQKTYDLQVKSTHAKIKSEKYYKKKMDDRTSWFDKMDIIMQGIESLYEHDPELGKAFLTNLPENLVLCLEGVSDENGIALTDPIVFIEMDDESESSQEMLRDDLLRILNRIDIVDCICILLLVPVLVAYMLNR